MEVKTCPKNVALVKRLLTMFLRLPMLPTDDCDIDDTVGKNTEGDCDTLAREASKELLQD